MIQDIIATTQPAADFMISGKWLIAFVVAVIPVLGGVWIKAKQAGRAEAQDNNVTLKKPVPTIQTREEPLWATKPDLEDHVGWTRGEFKRVWDQFGAERTIDNDELNKIHERINQQSLTTASLKGTVEKIGENVAQLLHLALHDKAPTRPPRPGR
jgi:hypothetical protein